MLPGIHGGTEVIKLRCYCLTNKYPVKKKLVVITILYSLQTDRHHGGVIIVGEALPLIISITSFSNFLSASFTTVKIVHNTTVESRVRKWDIERNNSETLVRASRDTFWLYG